MFDAHDRTWCDRTRPASPRSGGGARAACRWRSKKKIATEPELEQNLKSVLEVRTAGDPDEEQSVWTEFSPTQIAEQVAEMGTPVSPHVVRDWLAEEGLALHKIAKDVAGGQSPDREAQFQRIAALKAEYLDEGNPVFSVDTKAKAHLRHHTVATVALAKT